MGRRIAYVVLPTYDWSELGEKSVVDTLVACNLLPSQLASYGRQEDADAFRSALEGLGFQVTCESCRVDRAGFKARLCELSAAVCERSDVFVLIFSGHGQQELLTRHASLVFSDNKALSSYSMDYLLASTAQRASVYTVLSCCTATGVPMALPVGTWLSSVAGQAAVDIAAMGGMQQSMAGQRRVEIFSTSHVETQKAAKGGTLFARALAGVLAGRTSRLETLDEDLATRMAELSNDSDDVPTTVKVVRYNFVGPTFDQIQEETKVRPPVRLTNKTQLFDPCDWYC